MFVALLDDEDFETLPTDPSARWVALEYIARERLLAKIDADKLTPVTAALIRQYMELVVMASEDLNVGQISVPSSTSIATLQEFMVRAQTIASRLKLQGGGVEEQMSLKVQQASKDEIRSLAGKILDEIPKLRLDERRERKLRKALRCFLDELDLSRARFSVGSGHLVTALTVISLAVTTTAAAPQALSNIQKIQAIWAEEKERSDSDRGALPYMRPQGLLPAPPPKQIEGPQEPSETEGET